jgi:hypothetical protein
MTRVTPFVSPADICDQCLLTLYLYFEGGNQCIFRIHDHVTCFAMKLETDSELSLHFSISVRFGVEPDLCIWCYLESDPPSRQMFMPWCCEQISGLSLRP